MSYTDGVIIFLGLSLLLYLVMGGADFGAGILEAIIGDRGKDAVYRAIGPVWEANHIWLIIAIVILFNGFPETYYLISTALHIPLMLVLIGIILRGTAFTFRHYDAIQDGSQGIYSKVFRWSSIFSVFAIGLTLAPLIAGTIPEDDSVGFYAYYMAPWLNGFSVSLGVFLMVISAYIAAVYLLGEVDSEQDYQAINRVARVLFISSIVSGMAVFAFSFIEDNGLLQRFSEHPLSLASLGVATLLAPFVLRLINRKNVWTLRVLVAAQLGLIFIGLLSIHYPAFAYFKDGSMLDLYDHAAPEAVMGILFWALVIGVLIIIPSLVYLIYVFKGPSSEKELV